MRIALANCARLPEPDPDERPLLGALREAGHEARTLAWDRPEEPESGFDAIVVRATWNYIHLVPEFEAWLQRVASVTRLLNPWPVLRWNLEKTYLRQLERAGLPVVPTVFVDPGVHPRPSVTAVLEEQGWAAIVIKPYIGAGSHLTRRFEAVEAGEAQRYLDAHRAQGMMIQPFMASVDAGGERSVVSFDGRPSHAVRKHPRFLGDDERVEAAELTPELAAISDRALAEVPPGALYARVDVIDDDRGAPRISEVELIEPSLFFDLGGPDSLSRMVGALEARLRGA